MLRITITANVVKNQGNFCKDNSDCKSNEFCDFPDGDCGYRYSRKGNASSFLLGKTVMAFQMTQCAVVIVTVESTRITAKPIKKAVLNIWASARLNFLLSKR